jgi:diguanylate cyclase (GGDEF)-like protein
VADFSGSELPDALSYESLVAAIEQVHVPIIVTDASGHVLLANESWRTYHAVPAPDVPISEWMSQFHFFDAEGEQSISHEEAPVGRVMRGERVRDYEYSVLSKDGELRFRRANGHQLHDGSGNVVGAVFALHDITLQRRADAALNKRALYDSLTGLANRALLIDRLQQTLARNQRDGGSVAVLLCDLDRFKWVNDAFGHSLGDRLLIEISQRISSVVRHGDTVARLGGDEFVILTESPSDNPADRRLLELSQRIRDAVGHEIQLDGASFYPSLSIGIATSTRGQASTETLLRDADTAMYQAKEAGDGYASFDEAMRNRALRRVEVRRLIETAIERGRLSLHYQPIVESGTGRLVSVEALVRINHEDFVVGPSEFIPVAEDAGIVEPIDRWAMEEATRQLLAWRANGCDPTMAVACNVSARSLATESWTRTALDSAKLLGAAHLRVELTETAMIHATGSALHNIGRLREAGIALGLDDFGTGYASLTHLRTMPVSFIKVDRSFVAGLGVDANDTAIVDATMRMAAALGLDVVAEGVEDHVQRDMLEAFGCRRLQGFLYAKPLPGHAIDSILQAQARGVNPLHRPTPSTLVSAGSTLH